MSNTVNIEKTYFYNTPLITLVYNNHLPDCEAKIARLALFAQQTREADAPPPPPSTPMVLHLYIKHTILFCLAKFLSKVGLKPEPVQPCHYHINRHIQYINSRRLYFTCQGERAATQWLERPWKSRGGVINKGALYPHFFCSRTNVQQ